MSSRLFFTLWLTLMLPATALGAQEEMGKPHFYINPTLGFNVEGYNYSQAEFPCQIDSVLVEKITDYATKEGLNVQARGAERALKDADVPVLAMDITALSLGEDYSFGTKSRTNLPSVQVTAALVGKQFTQGMLTAEHSCAISTLSEFTPSSSVLDLGTYGTTVCSATHKCLGRLARDIVKWAKPQVK